VSPPPGPGDTGLAEILDGLRRSGYAGDFLVDEDGSVRCRVCGTSVGAERVPLDGLRRVEGASDPGDMAAVLAVRCRTCGEQGTAVVRYGPEAGPGDAALLLAIDDERGSGLDVADDASRTEDRAERRTGGDPERAIGEFGDSEQADQGGDSDVGLSSDG